MFDARFQSFAELGGPTWGAVRVAELRQRIAAAGVDGFIVPRADEHQNEYVPANAERLLWLTGFAGSAGLAVVLKDRAAIFVDGRYTEQVRVQVDGSVFEHVHLIVDPPSDSIARTLHAGERLGYDPRLHTTEAVSRFAVACKSAGAELVALLANPIDEIWVNRPTSPMGTIIPHKPRFAGGRRVEDCAGAGENARRWIVDQRSTQSGVAFQHSRRGCVPYTARAWICLSSLRRATNGLSGRGQAVAFGTRERRCSRAPPRTR